MANVKSLKIGSSTYNLDAYNADTLDSLHASNFIYKNYTNSNRYYSMIGASWGSACYKITFPYSSNTSASAWFMNSFDIEFGGPYSSGGSGRAVVSYYVSRSSSNWVVNTCHAIVTGINASSSNFKIAYTTATPAVIYVYVGPDQYRGMTIKNLYSHDTGPSYNYLNTTIETATWPSSGITEFSVGFLTNSSYTGNAASATYATSAGSATSATKATKDSDGNTINSTYLKLSGGILTGNLQLKPASGEGGQVDLCASTAETTKTGITLDNYYGSFRLFGIASADGTTQTGTGTPLVINPYSKTITGGYTITGNLSGHASTAGYVSGTTFIV